MEEEEEEVGGGGGGGGTVAGTQFAASGQFFVARSTFLLVISLGVYCSSCNPVHGSSSPIRR